MKNVAARPHEVPPEEVPSFRAWFKALFDQNSDGIEDTILRSLFPVPFDPWSVLTRVQVDKAQNSFILHPSLVHARNPALGSTKDRRGRSQERRFVLPRPFTELDARGGDQIVDQGCTS